jgi:murein DD-endopeptidase MepM/ murein hydrolase activator NlpD
VRYLFITPRHALAATGAFLICAAALTSAAALVPVVWSDLRVRHELDLQLAQRSQQGERLQSLVQRLEALSLQTEDVRLRMQKIHLAYGFDSNEWPIQGGYPTVPRKAPDSIYAEIVHHGHRLQAQISEQMQVLDAFLREVQDFEAHHRDQVLTTPSISPLRGNDFVLTSPFGTRRNPFTKAVDFHSGLDLAAPTGTPIYAPAAGEVVFAGRYDLRRSVAWWRFGNLVVLRHGDRFRTIFAHCDEVKVRTGDTVRQGDVIATVGSTGWSTAPHLHYEVRRYIDGEYRPVDPRIYILDRRWRDEERVLVRARSAPDARDYEPLTTRLTR